MPSIAHIQEVQAHNQAIIAQAAELNKRAGQTVVVLPKQADLLSGVTLILDGARQAREVSREVLEALRLPPLDAELVARVKGASPDALIVLGQALVVEYASDRTPWITLPRELVATHGWRALPDAILQLPDGRMVEVVVPLPSGEERDSNLAALKRRCDERLTEPFWETWKCRAPIFDLPNLADLHTAHVAPLVESAWTTWDGSRRPAYGTAVVDPSGRSEFGPPFVRRWFRDRVEAEEAHAHTARVLEDLKTAAVEQRELERLHNEIRTLQGSFKAQKAAAGINWPTLPPDLRGNVTQVTNALVASLRTVEAAHAFKARAVAVETELKAQIAPKPLDTAKLERLAQRFGRNAKLARR